ILAFDAFHQAATFAVDPDTQGAMPLSVRVPHARPCPSRKNGDAGTARRSGQMHRASIVPHVNRAAAQSLRGGTKGERAGRIVTTSPTANQFVPCLVVFWAAKNDGPDIVLGDESLDNFLKPISRPDLGCHFRSWPNANPAAISIRRELAEPITNQ